MAPKDSTKTRSKEMIEHLIILMMENRSFDHYFGSLSLDEGRSDVEGLTKPLPTVQDGHGRNFAPWQMDEKDMEVYAVADPPHGWDATHDAHNGGRNDGFVKEFQKLHPQEDTRIPMGYYTRKTLPVFYKLADQFTVCDHWFCSVLSSTWPNRKYLHSGRRDGDNDTRGLPDYPGFGTRVIYDVLEDASHQEKRLSWRCYFSDAPFLVFWYHFAFTHIDKFKRIDDFVSDCLYDRLPTISIIDPPFTLADDHPSHDPRLGQKFVGLVVDALTNSEAWRKSALVILYDENGGFYDHVAPPAAFEGADSEDSPLGFRVPAIIVSPYSKRGHVSKVNYDHTSIIRSINARWKVEFDPGDFGSRWQRAPAIWDDCFNFEQAGLPMATYTGIPLRDLNWGKGIHDRLTDMPEGLERFLGRSLILPELKPLDKRAEVFETLKKLEERVITEKRTVDEIVRSRGNADSGRPSPSDDERRDGRARPDRGGTAKR